MSKAKNGATAAAASEPDSGVTGDELKELFFACYGPQHEYDALMQEHYEMVHLHSIRAEMEKDIIAERRRRRLELVEARRIQEEQRRIKEMRENPQNLNMCAAKIQKFVRRNIVMAAYGRTRRETLAEKPNKRALVIIANVFEDRRVRTDTQGVADAFDLARTMMCMGFQVDLLCDVGAYEEFSALYDEPLAQMDPSGRAVSARVGTNESATGRTTSSSPMRSATTSTSNTSGGGGGVLRSIRTPTRLNIIAALDAAANAPPDTMMWVHVCTVGGRAAVNGKNPARLAAESAVRTPRTRLIEALQSGHQSSSQSRSSNEGPTATAATADTCQFLFPSDGRSARLTFENIVRVDEVLEVLNPKHSPQMFGQPLHQRVVTMDVGPIGCVEGAQGGGFACFASTCTATQFYELPARDAPETWITTNLEGPTRGSSLGDPHTSLLTHALQQCFTGHCWTRIEATPRLYCGHIAAYVHAWMQAHRGVHGEVRGLKGWGDFPVLEGDKLASQLKVLEKVYFTPTCAHETVGGGASSSQSHRHSSGGPRPSITAGSAAAAVTAISRQGKHASSRPGSNKGTLFEIVLRFDITEDRNGVAGLDVFDPEFSPSLLQQLLIFFAHYDPRTWNQHRQLKVPVLRANPSRTLIIGLNTTFVDVSAKMKVRGVDPESVWPELVMELTGLASADLPHYAVHVGKLHEVGCHIPHTTGGSNSSAAAAAAAAASAANGGIVLLIQLLRADIADRVLRRLHKIPDVIPGVVHTALMVDVRCEAFAAASAVDNLSMKARQVAFVPVPFGYVPPFTGSVEPRDDAAGAGSSRGSSVRGTPRPDLNLDPPRAPTFTTSGGGESSMASPPPPTQQRESPDAATQRDTGWPPIKSKKTAPRRAMTKATDRGFLHMTEGEVLVAIEQHRLGILHGMSFQHIPQTSVGPTQHMIGAWGEYLDMCVQHLGPRVQKNVRALKHKLNAVRVLSVRTLANRVNDLDDESFQMMAKRDLRPPASLALAPHNASSGTALCVIALFHPTGEARCRQALHLQRAAQVLELVAGIRFALWDVANETFGISQTSGATTAATTGTGSLADKGGLARGGQQLFASAHTLLSSQPSAADYNSHNPTNTNVIAAASHNNNAHNQTRQNIVKFLDALKLNIGTNAAAYPVLMLWDLTRKRYYRLKAPQAGGGGAVGSSMLGTPCGGGGGGGGIGQIVAAAAASSNANAKPPFVTGGANNAMDSSSNPDPGSLSMRRAPSVAMLNVGGGAGDSVTPPAVSSRSVTGGADGARMSIVPGQHALPPLNSGGSGGGVVPTASGTVHIHGSAHIVFPAPSISHICEEFLKGNLNDLLPPVKGSKVIGGGRSMTKYSLMSL